MEPVTVKNTVVIFIRKVISKQIQRMRELARESSFRQRKQPGPMPKTKSTHEVGGISGRPVWLGWREAGEVMT